MSNLNYYTLESVIHPARPELPVDAIATVFSDDPTVLSLELRKDFEAIRAVLYVDEFISSICALRRGVNLDGLRLVA